MDKAIVKSLMAKKNVVSVGLGRKRVGGKYVGVSAIVVGVSKKVPLTQLREEDVVPSQIGDQVTDVVEAGEIRLLAERTDKWRPAPGGVSCGHFSITAGTLGSWVSKDGELYLLSNNHVLADVNRAKLGDQIYQPGPYDGGKLEDTIALLSYYVYINKVALSDCSIAKAVAACLNAIAAMLGRKTRLLPIIPALDNLVDCALAKPVNPDDVVNSILEVGTPLGWIEPWLGMPVKKSGRTTGLTRGEISQVDVTVNVGLGNNEFAIFTDQISIDVPGFSDAGDSGSVILSELNRYVGLLFAGSSTMTIANRFSNVVRALQLDEG